MTFFRIDSVNLLLASAINLPIHDPQVSTQTHVLAIFNSWSLTHISAAQYLQTNCWTDATNYVWFARAVQTREG